LMRARLETPVRGKRTTPLSNISSRPGGREPEFIPQHPRVPSVGHKIPGFWFAWCFQTPPTTGRGRHEASTVQASLREGKSSVLQGTRQLGTRGQNQPPQKTRFCFEGTCVAGLSAGTRRPAPLQPGRSCCAGLHNNPQRAARRADGAPKMCGGSCHLKW
jgi:hypothetical protein